MSDADSDADPVSDSSGIHVDVAVAGGDEASISVAVRELCNQLRANDPTLLPHAPHSFMLINYIHNCSESECIAVFQALKENTSVKHIDLWFLFVRDYTKRSALVIAEYVESSNTLQTLDLNVYRNVYSDEYSHEVRAMIFLLLRALSRNTSVTKLIIHTNVVQYASVAFEELLTRTQTLQNLQLFGSAFEEFDEVQMDAITSGFFSNTTLRDLEFHGLQEANLAPVLTALQCHPALQKIRFSEEGGNKVPSLTGLEVLLRSQDSKVKELVFEQVDTSTVGWHLVVRELGRNTTVINLIIRDSTLTRENVQQLKAVLRQNTALQHLSLRGNFLRSAGLAEIAPALYRNTSIKSLDLSNNGLDDIESANVLRELLRCNKTIASLCLVGNTFGLNAAAARSIFEGLRNNKALQQLDLCVCSLDDQGISLLANALAIRNASILELNLLHNGITSWGVRALVHNVEAVKTLTKLCLTHNPIGSEGATILADALGRNAMPSLKRLDLRWCGIGDDGFVALMSALEQNTSLQILSLQESDFGGRGFLAFAESLPNIKGLQEITIKTYASFPSTKPLLLEGFRKNTSLVEVTIDWCSSEQWSQELKYLGHRNRFTALLKVSDPPGASPWLGVWSRALAKVATEPDVLFHVLRNKPKLVGSTSGLKKRKRNGE
jgi:Ran GTPase-activating protein (RanGAP) involved in mRNA processing and transport